MDTGKLWQFFAGLAVFIFGMRLLEDSLKQQAGRTFKLFLKKHTASKPEAIVSGTLVTALLQSSSLTSLMVLTFTGAGVLTMRNALGVILGANLGSTFCNWIFAFLGFEMNVSHLSWQIIAISGLGIVFSGDNRKLKNISDFFFAFGLIFLGLDYMKTSAEVFATNFFRPFFSDNRIIAVFIGIALTALIQTSSATMVIALSALHLKTIPFAFAVGLVTGAELGTCIKLIPGSLGGASSKKRVAAGTIIFNLVTTFLATVFMGQLIRFSLFTVGNENYLIALVFYQTLVNLSGILLFYPFLNSFGDLLEKMFSNHNDKETLFISKLGPSLPAVPVEAMEKETRLFIYRAALLNLECFQLGKEIMDVDAELISFIKKREQKTGSYSLRYEQVKQAEGEIISFCAGIKNDKTEEEGEEMKKINHFVLAVRNAMYSAKAMKDIRQDEKNLLNSSHDAKYGNYTLFRSHLEEFYKRLDTAFKLEDPHACLAALDKLLDELKSSYDLRAKSALAGIEDKTLKESDISTMLNVNREMFSSCKSIIFSLKEFISASNGIEAPGIVSI